MIDEYIGYYESPIGLIEIAATARGIKSVFFVKMEKRIEESKNSTEALKTSVEQLDEYFRGLRKEFQLDISLDGTVFQNQVWEELQKIPYGETISYKELALRIGKEKAIRAVGHANGMNPISIIIPCHRVIGSNGSLTGYGGGLERKKWLINHEKKFK